MTSGDARASPNHCAAGAPDGTCPHTWTASSTSRRGPPSRSAQQARGVASRPMPDPVPPPDSSRRARWDERHAAQDPIESTEPDPTLIDEIGSLSPGRALDLGAGDGRNAVWLASRGWDVTAVDFSQVALDRGLARAEATGVHVKWELADLLEWTPGGRSYDLVTLFFIHFPRDERRDVY